MSTRRRQVRSLVLNNGIVLLLLLVLWYVQGHWLLPRGLGASLLLGLIGLFYFMTLSSAVAVASAGSVASIWLIDPLLVLAPYPDELALARAMSAGLGKGLRAFLVGVPVFAVLFWMRASEHFGGVLMLAGVLLLVLAAAGGVLCGAALPYPRVAGVVGMSLVFAYAFMGFMGQSRGNVVTALIHDLVRGARVSWWVPIFWTMLCVPVALLIGIGAQRLWRRTIGGMPTREWLADAAKRVGESLPRMQPAWGVMVGTLVGCSCAVVFDPNGIGVAFLLFSPLLAMFVALPRAGQADRARLLLLAPDGNVFVLRGRVRRAADGALAATAGTAVVSLFAAVQFGYVHGLVFWLAAFAVSMVFALMVDPLAEPAVRQRRRTPTWRSVITIVGVGALFVFARFGMSSMGGLLGVPVSSPDYFGPVWIWAVTVGVSAVLLAAILALDWLTLPRRT